MDIKTVMYLFIISVLLVLVIWKYVRIPLFQQKSNEREEYYELKAKVNYFIAVGSVALFLFTYLGLANKDELEKSFKNETKPFIDSIKLVKDSISTLKRTLTFQRDSMEKYYENSKTLVSDAQNKINKLFSHIYIVNSIGFPVIPQGRKSYLDSTYYFSDLKTVNNEPLPIFNSAPQVLVTENVGEEMRVSNITNKSFTISALRLPIVINKNSKIVNDFGIWVLTNK